ncbi:putative phosphoesterase, putative [Staphylococcus piscifermentans]|uniref:Phosphohydrolase n=1 Tax=Staphylococcus piscifermentans TaxID=70258 RepID=A0A239TE94_9STAP|nr:metallophosphoesterase [Staphylococcus piscifermentans]RTX86675.1 phosphohydrolase [Staphylococcus piscifermentans]GEP83686.1 phosphohydrolase [Staphylococcus piscifermentans]SNU95987.1 putative phosphoesterase, putative [Staphylococcus piscifermentans]
MKIGTISDLHIDRPSDYTETEYAETLAQLTQDHQLDVLLIAGDISNDYRKSYQFVKAMQRLTYKEILFIPGNHDYWQVDDKTTHQIHEFFMQQPECLMGHPYIINDEWAIVGNSGWYDYTYASPEYTTERLERRRFKGATWQDKVHVDWGMSDIQVSHKAAALAKRDLQKAGDRKIILATHVVTTPSFRVPMPHRIFNYFNAFIGTSDFEPLYHQYNIQYSLMGHVHFRGETERAGIEFACVSLGYFREWRTKDIEREMSHALKVIEI